VSGANGLFSTATINSASLVGCVNLGGTAQRTYQDRLFQGNKVWSNHTQSTLFGGVCYLTNNITSDIVTSFGGGIDAQYILTGSGNATYATDTLWGVGGSVLHQGSGYVNTMAGVRVNTQVTGDSGSAGNVIGYRGYVIGSSTGNTGSNINTIIGYTLDQWGVNARNTCSNAYGIYLPASQTGGKYLGNRSAFIQIGTTDNNVFYGPFSSSNIAPRTTNVYDLGTAGHTFNKAYIHQVSATGLTGSLLGNASTASYVSRSFSRGGTIYNPSGISIAPATMSVWWAPYDCRVISIKGYRVGGTGATINAHRSGSATNHLASALSLTDANMWMDAGSITDATYTAGDGLEIALMSVAGTPTQVSIQVNYTR
jgi:hypothetical protein